MGIYDRDYYRQPASRGFGTFSMLSVTTWLIILNVAVFLIDALLLNHARQKFPPQTLRWPLDLQYHLGIPITGPLEFWGGFSKYLAVTQLQLWRFFTYQFLHANLQHLLFNMLGLYFFGPIVETFLGARRYLVFYLLCGCSGAVLFLILQLTGVLYDDAMHVSSLVGASAAIFGVLIAGAVIAPNVEVVLLFPPIPVQLKYLAMILVAIAAYTAFTNGRNAGGEAAHLGGAVLGYFLIRYPQFLWPFGARRGPRIARQRTRVRFSDWSKDMNH